MRPSPRLNSNGREEQAIPITTEFTIKLTPFDQGDYRKLIEAREGNHRAGAEQAEAGRGSLECRGRRLRRGLFLAYVGRARIKRLRVRRASGKRGRSPPALSRDTFRTGRY
jgi:hypothetical protein